MPTQARGVCNSDTSDIGDVQLAALHPLRPCQHRSARRSSLAVSGVGGLGTPNHDISSSPMNSTVYFLAPDVSPLRNSTTSPSRIT